MDGDSWMTASMLIGQWNCFADVTVFRVIEHTISEASPRKKISS